MEQHLETTQDLAVSETDGTVSIELNFKAFADNVPTTQHAKRAPSYSDPSIQDFADQALELATLRAELKRLMRDYEILQQQAAAREARLDELRRALTSARMQLREERRRQSQAFAETTVSSETTAFAETTVSAGTTTLTETTAALAETTAALAETTASAETAALVETVVLAPPPKLGPQLIPVDRPDSPVALSRDIITVGRTSQSDICIRSSAVSRDHARLLVAPGGVTLVDVSTTNGCFVNDARVKKQRLRDGDLVRIGDRSFRFACSPASQPGWAMSAEGKLGAS